MSREAQIPLVLWISAAIVAHWMGGNGAIQVARVYEDRAQIRSFVDGIRSGLRPADTTFEILTDGILPTPPPQPLATPSVDAPNAEAGEPDPNAVADARPTPPKPKVQVEEKKPPPESVAKAPDKPPDKPQEPEPAVAVPAVPAPPLPPLPPPDHRIAIRQNTPEDQEDNPTAPRIADHAHHTAEETVARVRSYDQDDPNPTLGRPDKPGPEDEIGDSDEHKIAQSEDKKGDVDHAPGEAKPSSTAAEHHVPPPPKAAPAAVAKSPPPSDPGSKASSSGGKVAQTPALPAAPPPAPGGAGPASPEAVTAAGGYTLDPANPGGDGKSRKPGRKQAFTPYQSPVRVGSMGLGAPAIAGGPNLNLDMAGVEKAVGHEQLRAERAADGAARRSAHRGRWEKNKFDRWRAAIENYEPTVKLGNQTALNAAAAPFASYVNGIHNRLHPIFADEFLAALDNLPPDHMFNTNQAEIITHLEIVLTKDEGRIVRLGVTRPSGITAFDIVALSSVERASPFGRAPDIIVSPDGNVYLHWEFHRNPFDACTTRNAHPYLLKAAPALAPPPPLVPRKAPASRPSDERSPRPGPLLPLR